MTDMPSTRLTRVIAVPAAFDIRRTRGTLPSSPRPQPRKIDAETVIARLEEAGRTLLSLPRTGEHRHAPRQRVAAALGAFATAEFDPPPAVPPAARITRMDQALAWIPLIPAESLLLRRIVGCRCLVSPVTGRHLFSWHRLARLLGADHKTIRRWHGTGIDLIVATLERDAAIVRLWDCPG